MLLVLCLSMKLMQLPEDVELVWVVAMMKGNRL